MLYAPSTHTVRPGAKGRRNAIPYGLKRAHDQLNEGVFSGHQEKETGTWPVFCPFVCVCLVLVDNFVENISCGHLLFWFSCIFKWNVVFGFRKQYFLWALPFLWGVDVTIGKTLPSILTECYLANLAGKITNILGVVVWYSLKRDMLCFPLLLRTSLF